MKKRIALCSAVIAVLLLCVLLLVHSHDGVRKGMTYEEAKEKVDIILFHDGHLYYRNWAGNCVVARFGSIYDPSATEIVEIRCYNALLTSNSHAAFRRIKSGMTPFQVTALVGLPDASRTGGINSIDYKATDGTVYRIGWSYSKDDKGREDAYAPIVHSVSQTYPPALN